MLLNRGQRARLIAFDNSLAGNLGSLSLSSRRRTRQLTFVKGYLRRERVAATWAEYGVTESRPFGSRIALRSLDPWLGPFIQATSSHAGAARCVLVHEVEKCLYVSTAEVYGTLPEDKPESNSPQRLRVNPTAPPAPANAPASVSSAPIFTPFTSRPHPRCSNITALPLPPTNKPTPPKNHPLFIQSHLMKAQSPAYGAG